MRNNYTADQHFQGQTFTDQPLEMGEYEYCAFSNCIFVNADLSGITFSDCTFSDCDLSMAKLSGTAFREVKLQTVGFALRRV
jgi:fluoroquinolone resistance protein